jgi:hypothetical protein
LLALVLLVLHWQKPWLKTGEEKKINQFFYFN